MKVTKEFESCDKVDCQYYRKITLIFSDDIQGTLTYRHCVSCIHFFKHDFYTRLVIGSDKNQNIKGENK